MKITNYNSNSLAASSLDGVNYGFLANYNYFGFLYKSRRLDKLIIGCLSTSPCLSLFWVTPPGDITVSCLMAETHQLPLFLPSGPEVSKGDDNN